MTAISRHAPGSFCWFELATTDQDAAKHFYQTLFGWGVHDEPIGPSDLYSLFRVQGRDVAAAYTMRPDQRAMGMPPNWLLYVAVANADRSAARAAELGGTVVKPAFDVNDAGRMSVIKDSSGAVFAVWQAGKSHGTGIGGINGTACWADLSTPDQTRAAEFYSELFGWKIVGGKSDHPAQPGEYFHIVNEDEFIGGIPPAEHRDPNAPPAWTIYFEVSDCSAATTRAKELGARAYVEPMQVGEDGRIAVLADPQGAVFALHQHMKR